MNPPGYVLDTVLISMKYSFWCSDALSGKLASKDMEIETLKLTIDKMKEKELQLLEELKVDELEEKVSL